MAVYKVVKNADGKKSFQPVDIASGTVVDDALATAREAKETADNATQLATEASEIANLLSDNVLETAAKKWVQRVEGDVPTDPDKLAELLENAPVGSIVYFTVGDDDPTNSINIQETLDALDAKITGVQDTLTSNIDERLPLVGGELTGRLDFKLTNIEDHFNTPVATTNSIAHVVDAANNKLASLNFNTVVTDSISTLYLTVYNSAQVSKALRVGIGVGGNGFAAFPYTPSIYSDDLVNNKRLINYAPNIQKAVKRIYVGGDNASDTANLYSGRGESASLPFATLKAALNYIKHCYVSGEAVSVTPVGELTLDTYQLYFPNLARLCIWGDNSNRPTITMQKIEIASGGVNISGVDVVTPDNASWLFSVSGYTNPGTLVLSNISINGTLTQNTIEAIYNGKCILASDIEGTVSGTGYRYRCSTGGCINSGGRGAEAIPGVKAGIVDTASGSLYY